MDLIELRELIVEIVKKCNDLKNKYIDEEAPVNYVCVFSHSD